jgi:hypothetical protein
LYRVVVVVDAATDTGSSVSPTAAAALQESCLNHCHHSHPYQQYLDSPVTQGLCRKQQEQQLYDVSCWCVCGRRWMWRRWRVFVRPTKVSFHSSTVCPINASINEWYVDRRLQRGGGDIAGQHRPESSSLQRHQMAMDLFLVSCPGCRDMTKML